MAAVAAVAVEVAAVAVAVAACAASAQSAAWVGTHGSHAMYRAAPTATAPRRRPPQPAQGSRTVPPFAPE